MQSNRAVEPWATITSLGAVTKVPKAESERKGGGARREGGGGGGKGACYHDRAPLACHALQVSLTSL